MNSNENQANLLHNAVRSSQIEEVKSLIANGVDINCVDDMSRTALHLACWKGDENIVRLLIRSKANATLKAKDNFTALHFAVQSGHAEICRMLVKYEKQLLHSRVAKGNKNALHLAAAKGNIEVVRVLLELGCDPSAMTNSKQSVLDFAKDNEIYELIKTKIQYNIDMLKNKNKRKEVNTSTTDILTESIDDNVIGKENDQESSPLKSDVPPSTSGTISLEDNVNNNVDASITSLPVSNESNASINIVLNKNKKPKIVLSHLLSSENEC
jgi:ankyrin repeat protein